MGQPMPTFLDPAVGGLPGPSISELEGRFCAFIPTAYDPDTLNFDKTAKSPTVYTDVIVLTGGQMYYGAAPKATPARPHPTHVTQIDQMQGNGVILHGAEFKRRAFNGTNVVSALREHVGRGVVLGVVELSLIGSKGNKPWNITPLEAGDPRRQLAMQWFAGRAAGTVLPHESVELTNQQPAPVQQNYAQPVQPQYAPQSQQIPAQQQPGAPVGYYAPGATPLQPQMTAPGYGQPQPQVPAAQGYAQAQQAPMAPQMPQAQPMPQQPMPAAYGQPQAAWNPASQQQPAPQPVQPAGEFIPPGFELVWAGASPDMKASILAGYQAQQAAQAANGQPTHNPY